MSTVEYCGWSDLPVYECDHCPVDARRAAEDALRDANRGSMGNHTGVIPEGPENAILWSGKDAFDGTTLHAPIHPMSDPTTGIGLPGLNVTLRESL